MVCEHGVSMGEGQFKVFVYKLRVRFNTRENCYLVTELSALGFSSDKIPTDCYH